LAATGAIIKTPAVKTKTPAADFFFNLTILRMLSRKKY
jgi:hypothetical protein